uniref:Uncharacterized protein n=1 Tax=Arundo donax TaxID=35708 RepID=A0A0A9AQF1_ARUDO
MEGDAQVPGHVQSFFVGFRNRTLVRIDFS